MRSGLHGNRKNSNSNPAGGPHTRHGGQSTGSLQAAAQPLATSSSSNSMPASSATGSNAINSNRMYNESSNYLAEQPAAGQAPIYPNSKGSYTGRTSGQPAHQLAAGANAGSSAGTAGSNQLSSGLAGGSASQPLSGPRTPAYPSAGYRNAYDYGPGYPKKKSPNELATSSQPAGRAADHSHYSSSKSANPANPTSSAVLNSGGTTSSFNQKSTRDLDQKSVSSASSLKGSRNNNSRGKKSPRDEPAALLPNADHHAGYHNQNVYSTAYREGARGDRREPRSKRAEATYVNSAGKDEHKQQFDLQATAFPPLPGAGKSGDSANGATSPSAGQPTATSSTAKPAALKADSADAGCLADVVKGVKVQREPKSADEPATSNSKKDQKPAPNHSLNSSSPNRPASFDESSGKAKSCSSTASSPPTATNHHPNASQVDSYANLTSNSTNNSTNSHVPAKSNKTAKSGQSKGEQLSADESPLNDSRTADSSSVSSKSACSYDSQRSDLPGSKLSIDSSASSTASQPADGAAHKLAQAAAELTLNGHLDGSKKLMSYSDVAKLLKNNGNGAGAGAGAGQAGGNNGNGLSLNDCSQNSSASSSNSNVNSLSAPSNSKCPFD